MKPTAVQETQGIEKHVKQHPSDMYQWNTVNERLYRTNNLLLQKINKIKTEIKLQGEGNY